MSRQSNETYSQAGDWLMAAARRNPEALLLLAAGCALFLRSGKTDRRETGAGSYGEGRYRGEDRVSSVDANIPGRDAASAATQHASDYVSDVKDQVSEAAMDYAGKVSDYAEETRRTVSAGSQRLARQAQTSLQGTVDRMLSNQPLAVAAAGLAAGALVAAVFPSTAIEGRAFGDAHNALTDAVDTARKTVVGAASKAGERLKTAAEERGLTSEGLKDLASEVADTFTDAVGGKSGDDQTTSVVPNSAATANYGVSELGSERSTARDATMRTTAAPSGGTKR